MGPGYGREVGKMMITAFMLVTAMAFAFGAGTVLAIMFIIHLVSG